MGGKSDNLEAVRALLVSEELIFGVDGSSSSYFCCALAPLYATAFKDSALIQLKGFNEVNSRSSFTCGGNRLFSIRGSFCGGVKALKTF